MRIVEQTHTVLKLKARGISPRLSGVLSGAIAILSGLAILIPFGKLSILKCDRVEPTQVTCEVTSYGLLGKHVTPIPTGELRAAEIEVSSSSDGDTYRVALLTQHDRVPLTSYSSSEYGYHGMQQNVDQTNAFLNNSEQRSLRIQQDDRLFGLFFGGILMLPSGLCMLGSLREKLQTSCIFDKSSGRMYLTQKSAFKSEIIEQRLDKIEAAQVIEGEDSEGDKIHEVYLGLKSGDQILLKTLGPVSEQYKTAQSINQFLVRSSDGT